MARFVVIEEFHVTVLVPRGLSNMEADAVRQTLTDALFEARLLGVIRRVFRAEATLHKAKVRLSR
jgi:2C-methyl-D-erythritol 2,4-cyclodiphosphate synthase